MDLAGNVSQLVRYDQQFAPNGLSLKCVAALVEGIRDRERVRN